MTTILITMPKLSPTMEEGEIAKWHKKEGDFVEVGDLLMEVATDKATVEHTAIDSGYLRKIIGKEGDILPVNTLIAILTEEKDAPYEIPKEEKKEPLKQEEPKKKQEAVAKEEAPKAPIGIFASPLAKRLAKERGIDLSLVKGSGPRGRIMSRDLEGRKGISKGFEETMSPMRKSIAKHLQEAKRNIPHFYVNVEVDADPLALFRSRLVTHEKKITFNDCIVKAAALALAKHPDMNVGCNAVGDRLIRFKDVDIAVAVSIPGGLITPIVKGADKKSLALISEEIVRLRERATAGKLNEEEYRGGSFTISNLGMFGVTSFQAIVNPPQAAILSVGAILEKPVVKQGVIAVGKTMMLSLSVDHRVIDGGEAALFLRTLKLLLEEPLLLLV